MNAATLEKLTEIQEHLELDERRRGKKGTAKGIVHKVTSQMRAKEALEKKFGITIKTQGGVGGKGGPKGGIVAVVKGKTYPVKEILKKYGFEFRKTSHGSRWINEKGLKLDYAAMYHELASALHKEEDVETKEQEIEMNAETLAKLEEIRTALESKNPLGKMPMKIRKQKGSVRGGPAKRLKMRSKLGRGRPMDDTYSEALPTLEEVRERLEAECAPCRGDSEAE